MVANDNMVKQRNIENLASFFYALGYIDIFMAGLDFATGMAVRKDDRGGIVQNGSTEYFATMGNAGANATAADFHHTGNFALIVEDDFGLNFLSFVFKIENCIDNVGSILWPMNMFAFKVIAVIGFTDKLNFGYGNGDHDKFSFQHRKCRWLL